MSLTPLKIDKPIRLIELFAGIGSQAKALKRLGANFEHYRICEFDKYAIKSYNAVHGTNFETSDITKITATDLGIVDTDKYTYICCYSFPCQDLSLAGKQKLMAKGSGTRSSLLWEVERLLNECTELPQILLMENVTQVHGTKNKEHFDEWLAFLESKGYRNYFQDLNAKNYGIPQNRNRCFMVSVLGDCTYEFPKEFPLQLRLKDLLEKNVDEKFYLSDKKLQTIHKWNSIERPLEKVYGNNSICRTLTTRSGAECGSLATYSYQFDETTNIVPFIESGEFLQNDDVSAFSKEPWLLGGIGEKNFGKQYRQGNRIYDSNAVAMALGASPVGNAGGQSYLYAVDDDPTIKVVGNYSPSNHEASRIVSTDGIAPTVKENHGTVTAITDPFIVASRGRNPENPSNRTAGIHLEQRLEPNFSGCTNTLTTVQKDNYVAEPLIIQKYGDRGTNQYSVRNYAHTIPANPMSDRVQMVVEPRERFYKQALETLEENICSVGDTIDAFNKKVNKSGTSPVITTRPEGFKTAILPVVKNENLRIRKLTPKECWRLMGFDDVDFERAAKVNSNTQLYKQAGNSIVVDVLYYIFSKML